MATSRPSMALSACPEGLIASLLAPDEDGMIPVLAVLAEHGALGPDFARGAAALKELTKVSSVPVSSRASAGRLQPPLWVVSLSRQSRRLAALVERASATVLPASSRCAPPFPPQVGVDARPGRGQKANPPCKSGV